MGCVADRLGDEKIIACGFHTDTSCVKLRFSNGSVVAIDTTAVENEVAGTVCQCPELGWLVYNRPLKYA